MSEESILDAVHAHFADVSADNPFATRPADQFIDESFFDFAYFDTGDQTDWYWVNEPYAYVSILDQQPQNEQVYHVVEPHLNDVERYIYDTLSDDLQDSHGTDLPLSAAQVQDAIAERAPSTDPGSLWKLLYYLRRDFVHTGQINVPMRDPAVTLISCPGVETPVFVRRSMGDTLATNITFSDADLDSLLERLAAYGGGRLSKDDHRGRHSLPDGSTLTLTRGRDILPNGPNFTVEKSPPRATPIDLINSMMVSVDAMAFLWLCIEHGKSVLIAGETDTATATMLQALSVCLPPRSKIASIEETSRLALPHCHWITSVTRHRSTSEQERLDRADLLEAVLQQHTDCLVVDEIDDTVGEALFQAIGAGQTALTTIHAESVDEAIKRLTSEPIGVPKPLITNLDLVAVQSTVQVDGQSVRRNTAVTEINESASDSDEINVRDVYQYDGDTDMFIQMGQSAVLEEIKVDRGWNQERLDEELFIRKVVLAYLIKHGLHSYQQVADTFQGFMTDSDAVVARMATDDLTAWLRDRDEAASTGAAGETATAHSLARPTPSEDVLVEARAILDNAAPLFETVRENESGDGTGE